MNILYDAKYRKPTLIKYFSLALFLGGNIFLHLYTTSLSMTISSVPNVTFADVAPVQQCRFSLLDHFSPRHCWCNLLGGDLAASAHSNTLYKPLHRSNQLSKYQNNVIHKCTSKTSNSMQVRFRMLFHLFIIQSPSEALFGIADGCWKLANKLCIIKDVNVFCSSFF